MHIFRTAGGVLHIFYRHFPLRLSALVFIATSLKVCKVDLIQIVWACSTCAIFLAPTVPLDPCSSPFVAAEIHYFTSPTRAAHIAHFQHRHLINDV
jgi:hypothetical protein